MIPTVAAVDVPAALHDFRARYPHVRIGLRVGTSEELVDQVKRGVLDVGFLGLPATDTPTGVGVHELARDRLVAVVAPEHPLAEADSVDLRGLASELFVDFPANTAGRAQSDQAFAAARLDRDVAFEVSTADLMARLIQQGLGVGLLPAAYTPRLSGVVTVPVTDAPGRVEYLVWNRADRTPAATAFLTGLALEPGPMPG